MNSRSQDSEGCYLSQNFHFLAVKVSVTSHHDFFQLNQSNQQGMTLSDTMSNEQDTRIAIEFMKEVESAKKRIRKAKVKKKEVKDAGEIKHKEEDFRNQMKSLKRVIRKVKVKKKKEKYVSKLNDQEDCLMQGFERGAEGRKKRKRGCTGENDDKAKPAMKKQRTKDRKVKVKINAPEWKWT